MEESRKYEQIEVSSFYLPPTVWASGVYKMPANSESMGQKGLEPLIYTDAITLYMFSRSAAVEGAELLADRLWVRIPTVTRTYAQSGGKFWLS